VHATGSPIPHLRHDAYPYDDGDRYVSDVLAFIRDGLDRDEPVLVAVPDTHLDDLRAALSPAEAGRIRLYDMAVAGRNPGRVLGSLFGAFVRAHEESVRIVSEVVAPIASEPSRIACGTAAIESSAIEETKGMIMIPMTRPAASADSVEDGMPSDRPRSRTAGATVSAAK